MAGKQRITKAVIPVAGRGTRLYPAGLAVPKPLFPLVQSDGLVRPVIQTVLRQALAGGIEQIALVVSPEQIDSLRGYLRPHEELPAGLGGGAMAAEMDELAELGKRITYITQTKPQGLGHAVWCARDFADGEPVLVVLGDHVFLSPDSEPPPARRITDVFARLDSVSVTGVEVTPGRQIHLYGALAGALAPSQDAPAGQEGLYRVSDIVEKPNLQTARGRLVSPGLPEDHYLTHLGLYAFAPEIFEALDHLVSNDVRQNGEIQLTAAQKMLIDTRQDYYALLGGQSHDIGTPSGLAETQAALAGWGHAARQV